MLAPALLGQRRQLGLDPREVDLRRQERDALADGLDHLSRGDLRIGQQVVDVLVLPVGVDAQVEREMGLRVHVDEEHAAARWRPGRAPRLTVVVVLPTPPF